MTTAREPDRLINTYRRLADGGVCRIRPSRPEDRDLVEACFNGLSPQSWHQRFFSAKHALTTADLDRLCAVDGRDHIAFAAVRIDDTGRELEALGFARCMRLGADSDQGELAVTVVDRCQRQGIGTALLNRLVPAARAQGIDSMRCEVLTTNSGMRRLAHYLGGHVLWSESGTMEYDCPLPAPADQVAAPVPAAAPGIIPALAGGQAPIRVPRPEAVPGPVSPPMPDRSPRAPASFGTGLPWFLSPTAWLDAWLDTASWRKPWAAPMLDPSIAPAIAEGADLWWHWVDDCVAVARIGIDALSAHHPPLDHPSA